MKISKNILNYALKDQMPWALAFLLNEYGLTPQWFQRPLRLSNRVEGLVASAHVIVNGLYKGQEVTRKHKDDLLAHFRGIDFSEVEQVEGQWRSKIVMSSQYDSSMAIEYLVSQCTKVTCPKCGETEICHDHSVEFKFEALGQYEKCDCGAVFRAKFEEITYDELTEYDLNHEMEMQAEQIQELLQEYADSESAKGYDCFSLKGRNLNWRGSSGHKVCDLDSDEILRSITVDSDYTLEVTWRHDGTLEAVCSHHDATSYFEGEPARRCAINPDNVVTKDTLEVSERLVEVYRELTDYEEVAISPESWEEVIEYNLAHLPETAKGLLQMIGVNITVKTAKNLMELVEGTHL